MATQIDNELEIKVKASADQQSAKQVGKELGENAGKAAAESFSTAFAKANEAGKTIVNASKDFKVKTPELNDVDKKLKALKEKYGYKVLDVKNPVWSSLASTEAYGNKGQVQGLFDMADGFKEIKDKISETLKPLKTFMGRIGRIAVYRAIRTALKSISDAFREGTSNLYQWSKAQSSVQGNKFAQAMDKIATATLQFKNSIATVLEPILISLSAWIDRITPKIVALGEALAQFTAKLTGQGSYQKAIKQNIAYAASVQKILLGFDELNTLGGDGTGKNISTMFETVVLDNTMEKLIAAKMIKIGAIVGGATLGLGAILTLTGANIPVGLALMASGAVLIGKSIQANWDALSDKMKAVVGSILAVVTGATAVIGAILLFSGNPALMPLGIGLLATSVAGMVTMTKLDWGFLKDKIVSIWDSIRSWFNAKVAPYIKLSFWKEKGKNIVDGIRQGMMSAWESLKNWFKNAWNNLFGNLKTSLTLKANNRLSGDVWMEAGGGTVPTGDLFIAGEAGAELVTHLGGKNTVFNEQQLGNSLAYANESVVNAINTLIGVVQHKSNNVQISASDIRKAVNNSNMRLGV